MLHRLIVEGWRFIPHSYALVNQYQLLQMIDRPGLNVRHRDVPYYNSQWRAISGIFDSCLEQRIRQIPIANNSETADAVFRITSPYNLGPSSAPRTFVFGTAEIGAVPPNFLAGGIPLAEACAASDAVIVTPSHWSARGFIRSGANAARVRVVPLGIDPDILFPAGAEVIRDTRRQAQWDGFVFLHVGAMTGSKGIPLLLKAFAVLLLTHPDCRLVLKGVDGLYHSSALLKNALAELTVEELARVLPRLQYVGASLSCAQLAMMYQAADCYVSPYAAEGFNMPVLEAAACGLPVICTNGGPTDDFTTGDFALRINSTLTDVPFPDGVQGQVLQPDFDHLLSCMAKAVEDETFRNRARAAGPRFVRSEFTWQRVVDKLLAVIFPS